VPDSAEHFLAQARARRTGLVREMTGFLITHRKWWLAPILLALLLFGGLLMTGGTAAGPFIYTLF
jgi:hypothetical protein